MNSFYCHVENGGLIVSITQDQDVAQNVQYLTAEWNHYGNAGPKAMITLLTVDQVDAMIKLLEDAKKNIVQEHSFELGYPQPII